MKNTNSFASNYFVAIAVAYFFIGLVSYFPLRFQLNPDAISYLTIAKHYASGNLTYAINAYWSPLISWILIPACWLPWDPLFSFKILNLFFGFGGMLAARTIFLLWDISDRIQIFFTSLLAVQLLHIVYELTTPDLLSVVLLLFFFAYWYRGKVHEQPLITACCLAILYFVKSYNFFFISIVLLFDAIKVITMKEKRPKEVIRSILVIYAGFFLITAPWLFALHNKYGYFMLAGSAGFNHGATMYDNWEFMLKFIVPPNQRAVFPWEDPVLSSDFRDYRVTASIHNFIFQLKVIIKNIIHLFTKSTFIGIVSTGIVIFLGWIANARSLADQKIEYRMILRNDFFFLMIFLLANLSGYLMVFLEERYLWINLFLGIMGTALFIERYVSGFRFFAIRNLSYPIFLILTTSCTLILWRYLNHENFFVKPLAYKYHSQREYLVAQQFKNLPLEKKKMVAWPGVSSYTIFGSWNLAYHSGGRHYFCLPDDMKLANELIEKYQISIVFVPQNIDIPHNAIFRTWRQLPYSLDQTRILQRP